MGIVYMYFYGIFRLIYNKIYWFQNKKSGCELTFPPLIIHYFYSTFRFSLRVFWYDGDRLGCSADAARTADGVGTGKW